MASSRVSRGRRTQVVVAEYFAERGWPDAKSRPASLPGSDVYDVPGLSIEVKGTANLVVKSALAQAKANKAMPTDVSFVVWRRNGQGELAVGQYAVLMELNDFAALLRRAGLGEG